MELGLDCRGSGARELQADIVHGGEAGFTHLWFPAPKLEAALQIEGAESLRALCVRGGILPDVVDFDAPVTFLGANKLSGLRRRFAATCGQAAELDALRILVRPGFAPKGLRQDELAEETRGMLAEELAPVAERNGLGLLFEPDGHPESSVRRIEDALALVAGLPVGLGADAFESWRAEERPEIFGEALPPQPDAPPEKNPFDENPALNAAIGAALSDPTAMADPAMLAAALAAAPAGGGLIVSADALVAAPAPEEAKESPPEVAPEEAVVARLEIDSLAIADAPKRFPFPPRASFSERRLPGAGGIALTAWIARAEAYTNIETLVLRIPLPAAKKTEIAAVYAEAFNALKALLPSEPPSLSPGRR